MHGASRVGQVSECFGPTIEAEAYRGEARFPYEIELAAAFAETVDYGCRSHGLGTPHEQAGMRVGAEPR
jgi:hypothetical protein